MKSSIEVLEFDTVSEAEAEYLKRREQGCWEMVDRLRVVWSWRKFKSVCRFSIKKVDKRPLDYVELMGKLIPAIREANESIKSVAQIMRNRKVQNALRKLDAKNVLKLII